MTNVPPPGRPNPGQWRVRIYVISHLALAAGVLVASATWFRAPQTWIAFPAVAIAGLLMERFPLRSENLSNGTVLNVTASDAPALAAIFLLNPLSAAIAAGIGPAILDLKDRVRPHHVATNVSARMIYAASLGMIVHAPLRTGDATVVPRILVAVIVATLVDHYTWRIQLLVYRAVGQPLNNATFMSAIQSAGFGLCFGLPVGVLAHTAPWAIPLCLATFGIVVATNERFRSALRERDQLRDLHEALDSAWDATHATEVDKRLLDLARRATGRPDIHFSAQRPGPDELGAELDTAAGATRWLVASRESSNQRKLESDTQYLKALAGVGVRALEHTMLQAQLHEAALHDALTGLPNRRLFDTMLERELAATKRGSQTVAVLFVDIDGFKTINDDHGHAAGDHVLQVLAARLKAAVRQQDVVARLGGDEFTILCRDVSTSTEAIRVANRVLDYIETPITLNHHPHTVSASIGVAIAPYDGTTITALVRASDVAMYTAKRSKASRRIALASEAAGSVLTD